MSLNAEGDKGKAKRLGKLGNLGRVQLSRMWLAVFICGALLFVAYIILAWLDKLTVDQMLTTMLTTVLVLVTLGYVRQTERMASEMRKQRVDSARPILIPFGNVGWVPTIGEPDEVEFLASPGSLLIQNIGVGAALNVHVSVEGQPEGVVKRQSSTGTWVAPPIAAGETVSIKGNDVNMTASKELWVVITCDDVFRRGHATEARWSTEVYAWVDFKVIAAKTPGDVSL